MKKALKIAALLTAIIIFLLIVLTAVAVMYEDEVKAYVLKELNKTLKTPVNVEKVDFTLIDKFPYASLKFTNVSADEITDNPDKNILFEIQQLYLQFNIWDIFNKNYELKKITFENGTINLFVDKTGTPNYIFWKTSEDSTASNFSLALNDVHLKDIDCFYKNDAKQMHFETDLENVLFSGNFSETQYAMQVEASAFVTRFFENKTQLIKDKSIYLKSEIAVDNTTQTYTISQADLQIQDLLFSLSGKIINQSNGWMLNVTSNGKSLNIEELTSLIPDKYREKTNDYSFNGKINYNAAITGILSLKTSPKIHLNFAVSDAEISGPDNVNLFDVNLKGTFNSPQNQTFLSSTLILETMEMAIGKGHVSGNLQLNRLDNPLLKTHLTADLDLSEIKSFFNLDTLTTFSGQAKIDINFDGNIQDIKIENRHLFKLNGNAQFSQVALQFKYNNQNYELDTLSAVFNNNDVGVKTANVSINGNQLYLKGKISNFFNYLFDDNVSLYISGKFSSEKLDLNRLFTDNSDSDNKDEELHFSFPENISFTGKINCDTLIFGKFVATSILSDIQFTLHRLRINKTNFNACNGQFLVKGEIIESADKKYLSTGTAQLNNVDIHQLFYQLDNFGQNYIVSDNIYGVATMSSEFVIPFDTTLQINTDKLYAFNDILIEKGRLVNYEPVLALSDYIEVEELKDIKFSTLKTTIEIKNKEIIIPKTTINSSALNVTLSGVQGFNGSIDYRFSVLMNDILWRKAQKKNKNTEFGYITDDGTGRAELFLRMRGTVDDYQISYDTKGLKEKWKESLSNEKQTIKQILKSEFGWFKKDTTIKETKASEPEDNGLQFEFDDEENSESEEVEKSSQKNTQKSEEKNKDKDRKKGFWNKVLQPNEEEYEEVEP